MSPSRAAGMGLGPIPFEAIDAYAARYGIDAPEDFEEFHRLIRAADSAYLDAAEEKRERKRSN